MNKDIFDLELRITILNFEMMTGGYSLQDRKRMQDLKEERKEFQENQGENEC